MDLLNKIYLVTLAHLPQALAALCLFVVGHMFARFIKRSCQKAIKRMDNPTLERFIPKSIYLALMLLITIAALSTLGIPTASLLTMLGAFTLAIGFALKDFMANIAASFVIILLRPFKVGDFIAIGDCEGRVAEINLFMTHLVSLSNEAVFIPNRKIISDKIINRAFFEKRRLDLHIGISYNADLTKSKKILTDLLENHPTILKEPAPIVVVKNFADSSVELLLRFWVEKQYYGKMRLELMEMVKEQLDKHHIEIPYPQLDLHVKDAAGILSKTAAAENIY